MNECFNHYLVDFMKSIYYTFSITNDGGNHGDIRIKGDLHTLWTVRSLGSKDNQDLFLGEAGTRATRASSLVKIFRFHRVDHLVPLSINPHFHRVSSAQLIGKLR